MRTRRHTHLICLVLIVAMLLQVSALATPGVGGAADAAEPAATDPAVSSGQDDATPADGDADPDGGAGQAQAPQVPDGTDPAQASVEDGEAQSPEQSQGKEDLGIEIPQGWSYDALYFAVQNGILVGVDGKLLPKNPASRSQMATMLTRMIGAVDTSGNQAVAGANLSAFTDLVTCWYTPFVSAAVQLGIFNGTSATTFAPNVNISREQAFTVIGRVFGLCDGSAADLAAFSDASGVSGFAVPYVSALVKAGYVHGDNHNQLNPKSSITREELAQVLYNIFALNGTICTAADQLPETGNVLYSSQEPIPAGTTIQGNLVLSCHTAAEIHLENVTITGNLVVVTKDNTTVTLTGCQVNSIIGLAKANITCDSKVNALYLTGSDGVSYTGDAGTVTISANSTIRGNYGALSVTASNVTAAAGSTINTLNINCKSAVFCLDGMAQSVTIEQKYTTLSGSGYAQNILVHGKGYVIKCKYGTLKEDLDLGLTGTKMTLSTGQKVSSISPTATITATFTGVNGGYHATDGTRRCTLRWYVDGGLKKSQSVTIKNNATSSFSHTYTFTHAMSTSSTIKAVLIYDDEEISATTTVTIDKSVYIPQVNGSIASGDYTAYQKETFVNAKGYTSSSRYLVWINLYHTKVNVFTGTKGNWTLVKTYSCGIGAVNTPTPPGLYKMQTHEPYSRWYYGSGAGTWYVDSISRWNGGYAFHSRRKLLSTGAYQVNDLNVMISHGCIRMNTEEAQWLYNVPLGSTVVVY